MSQLSQQEALNLLAKGETTSRTLQQQTCWDKIAQDGVHIRGIQNNIKIVATGQTIQSAIDSITDVALDNPYMVMVPPGHEGESAVLPNFVTLVDFSPSPTRLLRMASTTIAVGDDRLLDVDWQTEFYENAVPSGIKSYLKNTGSNVSGWGGHGISVVGHAEDTSAGQHFMVGTEGYVVGKGDNMYIGVEGHARFNGNTAGAGVIVKGLDVTTAIVGLDDSTPLLEGDIHCIGVGTAKGGNIVYGIHVEDQTGANACIGIGIVGADTYALWVGMGADNTDAANGITFGASADVNLYRGGPNQLKTDDALVVGIMAEHADNTAAAAAGLAAGSLYRTGDVVKVVH